MITRLYDQERDAMEDMDLTEGEILLLGRYAEDRSRIYMLLSTFYMERPREEFVKKLKKDEFIETLKKALSSDECEIKDGLMVLETFINSIKDIPEVEVAENLTVDFTRLFRGIKKEYGPPPPYESVWRGEGRVMGQWTEKVLKEYADSGIGIDLSDELPDYAGIELKFMALLCYKEAEAWRDNDSVTALKFLGLEKRFMDEHLKNWIPEYCHIMADEARTNFYKGVAIITKGFLRIENN